MQVNITLLSRLDAKQAAIREVLDDLRTLLERCPLDFDALIQWRKRHHQIVLDYLIFKHQDVLEPLLACGDPPTVAAAQSIKIDYIALSQNVRLHSLSWPQHAVNNRPREYVREARSMIQIMERHLTYERNAIARLIERQAK